MCRDGWAELVMCRVGYVPSLLCAELTRHLIKLPKWLSSRVEKKGQKIN